MKTVESDSDWALAVGVCLLREIRCSLTQLALSDGEVEENIGEVKSTIERDLPRMGKAIALLATLGVQRKKDLRYFMKQGISEEAANDLAQVAAGKVVKACHCRIPRGNIGAWCRRVRKNVFLDHCRMKCIERKRHEGGSDLNTLPARDDQIVTKEILEDVFARCSPMEKCLIERRLNGDDWKEVGKAGGMTASKARKLAQRAWSLGGKSSPRPRLLRK